MKTFVLVKNGPADKAFELQEKPVPTPSAGEVLIRSEGFGLNFADVMARLGIYRDCPPLPVVIGYENAGRILSIGEGVKGLAADDRVVAFTRFGGYADHIVTPAEAVVKIPETMSTGTATALATQYVTAYYAAEEMVSLFPGDHVLVHAAAGGVGTALVQLLKRKGCTVLGTAGSDEKMDYLAAQGVDYPINYRKTDYLTEIRKLGFGKKLDATFNPVGGDYVKKDFQLLNAGGKVVLYGASRLTDARGNIFKMLKLLFGFGWWSPVRFVSGSTSLIGINMLRIADHKPEIIQRCMKAVTELAIKGELKPVVGKEFKAHQLPEAHAYLESRKSVGKVVISW